MPENYIRIGGERGSVNISEEVISVIALQALTEVEGVAEFANTVGSEIYEFMGKRPSSKGVRVTLDDSSIIIDLTVMVHYGYGIAKVAGEAQKAIISAVASMTGVTPVVNISVTGVAFKK